MQRGLATSSSSAAASFSNATTVNSLPSNAVVVADIGLHTTKSGIVLGASSLAYDDSTSQKRKGSAAARATAEAQQKQKNDFAQNESKVTVERTQGLDFEYNITDPSLVMEGVYSCLLQQQQKQQQQNQNSSSTTQKSSSNKNMISSSSSSSSSPLPLPGCVALLLPYGIRRNDVEILLQEVFEGDLGAVRVFLGCSSIQALSAAGVMTGTVVDVGHAETRFLPITEGNCHRYFSQTNYSLGGCQQSAAAIGSFLINSSSSSQNQNQTQNQNNNSQTFLQSDDGNNNNVTTNNNGGDDDLQILSERVLSQSYMKKMSTLQECISSIGDFTDDVKMIFNLATSSSSSTSSDKNENAATTTYVAPDGAEVSASKKRNNNNNNNQNLSPTSCLMLSDSFSDYLFRPQDFRDALCTMRRSFPICDALLSSPIPIEDSNLSFGIMDSLKFVLRRMSCEDPSSENSSSSSSSASVANINNLISIHQGAAATVVLAGGGSVPNSVETSFSRGLEQIGKHCITSSLSSSSKKTSTPTHHYRPLRDRFNAPWIGGSLFAQLPSLVDVTVNATKYRDEGPHACAHIYGVGGW